MGEGVRIMALTLGLKAGDGFTVGQHRIVLEKPISDTRCIVSVDRGKQYYLSTEQSVEVVEEVYVSVGKRSTTKFTRLAIDAPQRLKIGRTPSTTS
jgi:hypothetical protein